MLMLMPMLMRLETKRYRLRVECKLPNASNERSMPASAALPLRTNQVSLEDKRVQRQTLLSLCQTQQSNQEGSN